MVSHLHVKGGGLLSPALSDLIVSVVGVTILVAGIAILRILLVAAVLRILLVVAILGILLVVVLVILIVLVVGIILHNSHLTADSIPNRVIFLFILQKFF